MNSPGEALKPPRIAEHRCASNRKLRPALAGPLAKVQANAPDIWIDDPDIRDVES
jgi:hypothetical protein